jgi:hypothetical protein
MNKSLTSKLAFKQKLYSHRMVEGGSLEDNVVVFKKIVEICRRWRLSRILP